MPFKYNPFSGLLEHSEIASGSSFYKVYKTVDATLINNREIELGLTPLNNSELFFINGLILKDDNYTISSTKLIINSSLDIRIGDTIDIRFAN